jgi:hypothetical protein
VGKELPEVSESPKGKILTGGAVAQDGTTWIHEISRAIRPILLMLGCG